jgi:hypothetical protein
LKCGDLKRFIIASGTYLEPEQTLGAAVTARLALIFIWN